MENKVLPLETNNTIDPLEKLRKLNLPQKKNKKIIVELVIILIGSIVTFMLSAHADILETVIEFTHKHEEWELDEIFITSLFLAIALAIFSIRRWNDLHKTLSELKYIQGILPVCAGCGAVKDRAGNWHEWQSYLNEHTEAVLSHGLCPDCVKKFYGEKYLEK